MCDVDRKRHERLGLGARVPEHHSLVAGTLLVELVVRGGARTHLFGIVDALRDVWRLLVEGDHHAARVAVVAERLSVVPDAVDGGPGDRRDVHVGRGGDLAGDDAQTRRDHRLAGDPTGGVLREDRVEDRIGDLVGHLVGMALGHGLRCEGPGGHGVVSLV